MVNDHMKKGPGKPGAFFIYLVNVKFKCDYSCVG
jgi:hypothetical protein